MIRQKNTSVDAEGDYKDMTSLLKNAEEVAEPPSSSSNYSNKKRKGTVQKNKVNKEADFNKKVEDICALSANKIDGRIIKHAIVTHTQGSVEPSDRVIHFVSTLIKLNSRDDEEGWIYRYGKVKHPVQFLFQALTNFDKEYYDRHKRARSWMAEMVRELRVVMEGLITVTGYTAGVCRTFKFEPEFWRHWKTVQRHNVVGASLEEPISYRLQVVEEVVNKQVKLGYGFEDKRILNPMTVQAVEYMKTCTFRFALDLYNDDRLYNEIMEGVLKGRNLLYPVKLEDYTKKELFLDHIFNNLKGVQLSNQPQHHRPYNLQSSGRMHTGIRGDCLGSGLMAFPKEYRREMVLPTKPGYIVVELDLKSAHTVFLCEIFRLKEQKKVVLAAMDKEGSVWKPIIKTLRLNPIFKGSSDSKIKAALKLIIYPYCLGSERAQLPRTANENEKNTAIHVTKEMVGVVLGHDLIKPIADARDAFLNQYSVEKIENKSCQVIHTNALGMKFNVNKALEECKEEAEAAKKWREAQDRRDGEEHNRKAVVHPLKVAKQLLSHYLIGLEQVVMQDFIVNYLAVNEVNILCWSYDGVTVEIPEGTEEIFQESVLKFFNKFEVLARIDFEFGLYRDYGGNRIEREFNKPINEPQKEIIYTGFQASQTSQVDELLINEEMLAGMIEGEPEIDEETLYEQHLLNDEIRTGVFEDMAVIYKFPEIKQKGFAPDVVEGGKELTELETNKLKSINRTRTLLNKCCGTNFKPLLNLPEDTTGLITLADLEKSSADYRQRLIKAHKGLAERKKVGQSVMQEVKAV